MRYVVLGIMFICGLWITTSVRSDTYKEQRLELEAQKKTAYIQIEYVDVATEALSFMKQQQMAFRTKAGPEEKWGLNEQNEDARWQNVIDKLQASQASMAGDYQDRISKIRQKDTDKEGPVVYNDRKMPDVVLILAD